MHLFYLIHLLWIVPVSWIDTILARKKPFEERWQKIHRWSCILFRRLHVGFDVELEEEIPKDAHIQFVSNHQSFMDLVMLAGGIPVPFTFVSKKENAKIPYLATLSKSLELIYFDREDQGSAIHMLRETTRRLKGGQNVLIFPEGTRSSDNHMKEMHAGSIQPAFMAKSYIVPVVLKNSFEYKRILKKGGTFQMYIGKAIPIEEYKPLKAEGMIKRLQEQMEAKLLS